MKEYNENYVRRDEFNRLDERVTSLDLRQTRTEVRTDHVEQKIDKIESNTTWILRIIIGALVTSLLGLLAI